MDDIGYDRKGQSRILVNSHNSLDFWSINNIRQWKTEELLHHRQIKPKAMFIGLKGEKLFFLQKCTLDIVISSY